MLVECLVADRSTSTDISVWNMDFKGVVLLGDIIFVELHATHSHFTIEQA